MSAQWPGSLCSQDSGPTSIWGPPFPSPTGWPCPNRAVHSTDSSCDVQTLEGVEAQLQFKNAPCSQSTDDADKAS